MSAEYSTLHETVADPISCPRCEIDVYSLGIFIEDYLINTFMELARRNKKSDNIFEALAENHIARRDKMRELAYNSLNRSLIYFYAQGGPVIEPPVSEQYIMKATPSFNKKIAEFFGYLNDIYCIISKANNTERVERELTHSIIEMFAKLSGLYQDAEINEAFADLIRIEMAALQH